MTARSACIAVASCLLATSFSAMPITAHAAEPTFLAYNFADGALVTALPDQTQLSKVSAVLAVPEGPGPHPVAIVVHGSYGNCIDIAKDKQFVVEKIKTNLWPEFCAKAGDNSEKPPTTPSPEAPSVSPKDRPLADTGAVRIRTEEGHTPANTSFPGKDYVRWDAAYAHMVKEFARHGIAGIAIDVAVKESDLYGNASPAVVHNNLVKLHLDVLKKFNAGDMQGVSSPRSLTGVFDFSRVGLLGHSSGGGYALSQVAETATIPGLKAVVGLQPVVETYTTPAPKQKIPTMVIYSECDEQISPDDPQTGVRPGSAALAKRAPEVPFLMANVGNVHHVDMLSGGRHDWAGAFQRTLDPKVCPVSGVVNPDESRAQTAQLAREFFVQVLLNNKTSGQFEFSLSTAFTWKDPFASLTPAATIKATSVAPNTLAKDFYARDVVFQDVATRILPEYTPPR